MIKETNDQARVNLKKRIPHWDNCWYFLQQEPDIPDSFQVWFHRVSSTDHCPQKERSPDYKLHLCLGNNNNNKNIGVTEEKHRVKQFSVLTWESKLSSKWRKATSEAFLNKSRKDISVLFVWRNLSFVYILEEKLNRFLIQSREGLNMECGKLKRYSSIETKSIES